MRRWWIFSIVLLVSVALDQWTKYLTRTVLHGAPKTLISGYLDLVHAENPGAAFSFLRGVGGGRWILSVIAVVGVVLILFWMRRAQKATTAAFLGAIASGAIGNLIDRLHHGTVTDMVYAHWHEHGWPVFNVADVALVVGIAGLFLFPPAEPPKKSS